MWVGDVREASGGHRGGNQSDPRRAVPHGGEAMVARAVHTRTFDQLVLTPRAQFDVTTDGMDVGAPQPKALLGGGDPRPRGGEVGCFENRQYGWLR